MRSVGVLLVVLAPAVGAQAIPARGPYVEPAAVVAKRLFDSGAWFSGTAVTDVGLLHADNIIRPREVERSSAMWLRGEPARDSLRPDRRAAHAWLGGMIGVVVGAGVGYLIAIPRVRATERNSDGAPFQQAEYLVDPLLGGLVGGVVGLLVGGHIP